MNVQPREGDEGPSPEWQDVYGDMVDKALETFREDRRVLVVGSPSGTFDIRLMKHRRLLFWPTSQASANDAKRQLPKEAGAVFVTSMVSAKLQYNVRQQSKEKGIFCPPSIMSPGTITRILKGALAICEDEERAKLATEEEERMKRRANGVRLPQPAPVEPVAAAPQVALPANIIIEPKEPVARPKLPATSLLLAVEDARAALDLVAERAAELEAQLTQFEGLDATHIEKFKMFLALVGK